MPELPEVETVKIQLERFLVGLPRSRALHGHKVEHVGIRYKKCFQGDKKKLISAKFIGVRRFGKALCIDLSNEISLLIHFKMTGQLIYRGPNLSKPPKLSEKVKDGLDGKHTHVVFQLDRGGKLYFNDMRKFGWIKIVDSRRTSDYSFLKKLGPEPVVNIKNSPENPLTLEKFEKLVNSTSRAIKLLLMDQSKISGVGNIYANDALWLVKIHPKRKSKQLTNQETKQLFHAIVKVLRKGLNNNGASGNTFVLPDGREGKYQNQASVYGREGELCRRPTCRNAGVKIRKIKLSGRGTYFCSKCQK